MTMPVRADGSEYSALIFDWDGTLADSRNANYRALSEALGSHGVALGEEWYLARTGTSTAELIAELVDQTGVTLDVPASRVVEECERHYLDHVHEVGEIRWVADIARHAHGRVPIAVASGGTRSIIEATMRATGLARLFDVVVSREDAGRGKPAPDIFLLAARRLDAEPGRCLVYEDSDEGVEAAKASGMDVVDIRRQGA